MRVLFAGLLVAVAGCSAPSTMDAGVDASLVPDSDPEGTFTLYVSNQSFDIEWVDIVIEIDGARVVDDVFLVEDQHNWKEYAIDLSPGAHTLTARSVEGDATFSALRSNR